MHNIFEYISEHILVTLVVIVAIFTVGYVQETSARVVVLILMMGFYIVYGVLHHQNEKNLKVSTFLEYLFVALIFGLVIYVSIR